MQFNSHSSRSGFTLIELLVVVAIISLLSSVVLASLNVARDRAQNSATLLQARQIQLAMELYYNEFGGYPNPGSTNYFCIGAISCVSPDNPNTTITNYLTREFEHEPTHFTINKLFKAFLPNTALAAVFNTNTDYFSRFTKLTSPLVYRCTNTTGTTCAEPYSWVYYTQKSGNTTTIYARKTSDTVSTVYTSY